MKCFKLILSSLVLASLSACGDSGAKKADVPAVKQEIPAPQAAPAISPKAQAVIDEIQAATDALDKQSADVQAAADELMKDL